MPENKCVRREKRVNLSSSLRLRRFFFRVDEFHRPDADDFFAAERAGKDAFGVICFNDFALELDAGDVVFHSSFEDAVREFQHDGFGENRDVHRDDVIFERNIRTAAEVNDGFRLVGEFIRGADGVLTVGERGRRRLFRLRVSGERERHQTEDGEKNEARQIIRHIDTPFNKAFVFRRERGG